jgi:hypothetical protein
MKRHELDQTGTSNIVDPSGGEAGSLLEASEPERRKWHRKTVREHLWGPTGSFLFHVVLILLAVHLFKGAPERPEPDAPIIYIHPISPDLDELPPPDPIDNPDRNPADQDRMQLDFTENFPFDDPQPPVTGIEWDPPDIPPIYVIVGLRPGSTSGGRMKALGDSVKGNPEAYEAPIRRALEWLKERQLADGSWEGEGSARCKTALTGLGLLTFLAHGETPSSERYGKTVERAIRFLVEVDAKPDGSFAHADGSQYAQGIATYALGEAFAMTRVTSIQPVLEAALARILAGQQSTGAFNYGLLSSDTRRDTSVAGWMTQAMKAAQVGGARVAGLKEAMALAAQGIKVNYDADKSQFKYAPGGPEEKNEAGVSPSVTPIGVLCLQLLGRGRDPEVAAAVRILSKWEAAWTEKHPSSWPLYTWYYATQAFFNAGEGEWRRWYEPFALMLVRNQNADGSWTPNGTSESAYGPVYGTVFSALTLMTPYRYLPMYQEIQTRPIPAETDEDDILAGLTASNF